MMKHDGLPQGITLATHVNRYRVRIYQGDRQINGGYFDDLDTACTALAQLRNKTATLAQKFDWFLYGR